jgi:hypothetical protein
MLNQPQLLHDGKKFDVRSNKVGNTAWLSVLASPDGSWMGTDCKSAQIFNVKFIEGGIHTIGAIAGNVNGKHHHNGVKDGLAMDASFHSPYRMCLLRDGSLAVCDLHSNCIRSISPCGKYVATIAGRRHTLFALPSLYNLVITLFAPLLSAWKLVSISLP